MLIINTVKNEKNETLSELELLIEDFEEIIGEIPDCGIVGIHRTTILKEDGTEEETKEYLRG